MTIVADTAERAKRATISASIVVLAVLAATLFPRAQERLPSQTPRFQAGTDVVEVDAVVEDAKGNFVDDLASGDFEILEDGRPQQISGFYLLSSTASAPMTATGARAKKTPAATTPVAPHPRSTFVIVFDTDHLTTGDFKRVQTAAHAFLARQFQDGDVGGVILNGTMAGNRMTSNREELFAAVDRAKPPVQSTRRLLLMREWPRILNEPEAIQIANDDRQALSDALSRACADEPGECRAATAGGQSSSGAGAGAMARVEALVQGKARQLAADVRASADRSVRTFEALFNGLEKIDGRKNVILLSDGFYSDYSATAVRDIVARAVRANARVYSLDARGIGGPTASRDFAAGSAGSQADQYAEMLGAFDMESDAPNSLAVDTGGFVVRNANYFDAALARIARDAGNFYVLGYRPASDTADGKFHSIEVKVKRPGLRVRARRGYVVAPRSANASAERIRSAKALADRIESTPTDDAIVREWLRGLPASWPAPPAASAHARTGDAVPVAAPPIAAAHQLRPDAHRALASLTGGSAPSMAPTSSLRADLAARASEGWSAYEHGDVEHARDALAEVSRDPSAPAWVHYALGQAEYALAQYDAAVRSWESVRAAAPEFEPVYFDLADAHIQRRDNEAALSVLRAAQQRWPADAEALDAIGVIEVREGALDAAVETFNKAVQVAPNDGTSLFNLAKTYELRYYRSRRYVKLLREIVGNKKDLEQARECYNRYVELGGPLAAAAREGLERLEWAK